MLAREDTDTAKNPHSLRFGLEIDRRRGSVVFGDLAENVESGRVGLGCFTLGGCDHDGNASGQVVAECAAVAVDAGILCNSAIGNNKSVGKIEVRSIPAFAHRGRRDLLLEVRRREQTPSPQNRTPLAKVVKVGRR